ncbi:MAG: cytochrome c oxidase assembly protein [Acidobacteria bacterium]|nr:cytochrome c oxidase assembly protein [Acidobacteriota bacterium]
MSEAVREIFADWRLPLWLTLSIGLTAVVYIRGWLALRQTRRAQFSDVRLYSFLGGLSLLWLVIASPMDGFADALLTAHMVEHLMLMSAIPMLLLYGLPVVPLLRGLPRPVVRWVAGPIMRISAVRSVGHWMVTPAVSWLAMNVTYICWHIPAAYDFALENETWHGIEHLCFLFTSMLFWWYIMRPWPAEQRRDDWGVLVYLAFADIVMTLLSAFLAFCDRPVYQFYIDHPNPFHIAVVDDQVLGAVIMWVVGSFAYLVPAMIVTLRLLRDEGHRPTSKPQPNSL